MFLAIVFIILGLFLLLNAMGIITSTSFWPFFWAIVFLAIGIKMLMRKNDCIVCGFTGSKMHKHCCGHDHDHDADGQDHH